MTPAVLKQVFLKKLSFGDDTALTRLLRLIAVSVCATAPIWPARALEATTEDKMLTILQRDFTMSPTNEAQLSPELMEIDREIARNDIKEAGEKLTALLSQPDNSTTAPMRAAYSKSLLYLRLAQVDGKRGPPHRSVNIDLANSAKLGNLEALNKLLRRGVDPDSYEHSATPVIDGVDVNELIQIGVDLHDAFTLKMVSLGWGSGFSPVQRKILGIMAGFQTHDVDLYNRITEISESPELKREWRALSLVGDPIPETSLLPGRDMAATFFAEYILRAGIARSLGAGMPSSPPSDEPSLGDLLAVDRYVTDNGVVSEFDLITQKSGVDARARYIDEAQVSANIHPGDAIFVSCGVLAHTARVESIDIMNDELVLVDPLYQFWDPRLNFCVKSFSFQHFKYGFYLARLKLSEIIPQIDAIQTMRTYAPPSFATEIGLQATEPASGTSECSRSTDALIGIGQSDAETRDFFRFFNFIKFKAYGTVPNKVSLYFPGSGQHRGTMMVAVKTGDKECVRRISLMLSLQSLGRDDPTELRDLIVSFIKQSSGERDAEAMLASEKIDTVSEVLTGKMLHTEISGDHRRLSASLVFGDVGERWVRLDIQ